MSDRERWVVYPLLLMAIGLALQPRFKPIDVQFKTLTCEKLVCGEGAALTSLTSDKLVTKSLLANRANVTVELDAARAKTAVLSAGMMKADAASFDVATSKLHNTNHLRVADVDGVIHAEIRATPNGGQFDIVRYAQGGDLPFQDRDVRIFATDKDRNLIPLGVARLHLVAAHPPGAKSAPDPAPRASEPTGTP
jgi:hypothetical protein